MALQPITRLRRRQVVYDILGGPLNGDELLQNLGIGNYLDMFSDSQAQLAIRQKNISQAEKEINAGSCTTDKRFFGA